MSSRKPAPAASNGATPTVTPAAGVTDPGATVSLGHMPAGAWAFDDSVSDVFEDMIARSIPGYATMRRVTTEIGMHFVQRGSDIVDLGASHGHATDPFLRHFGAHNRYVLVEESEPMRERLLERLGGYGSIMRVLPTDLRQTYPLVDASLTLCVLTLIFVPINYRQRILRSIYESTRPGGALILVEKTIGDNGITDRLLVDRYHKVKHEQGYSWEEINAKAQSMEGVQVPVTARWNEEALRNAGFAHVDRIWTELNFAAWVGIRESKP
jgi:tRNA (cmo5U34)-methyltransferase